MAQEKQLTSASYLMPRRLKYTPRIHKGAYFVIKHLQKFIESSINQYVKAGSTIADVGCGEQPMRPLIKEKGGQYIGIDVSQNSQNNVDIVCSATSIELADNSVDNILCTEVIEHIPDIDKVFSELTRILRSDGYIILTCPFLYFLHEEPHDFNRPTPHLIQHMADKYSLRVVKLEKTGNEIEVICTVFDSILSEYIFSNRIVQFVWNVLRIGPRLLSNSVTLIISKIFDRILNKKYYLTNVVIFQKK